MLSAIAVAGYRSLREVVVPLHGLDVVQGANGSGKSSLYRSLRLLAGCGRGDVVGTLAREGGLQSVLWAGPATLDGARRGGQAVQGTVRKGPISLRLGFASDDFGYLVDLGLPQQGSATSPEVSSFLRDPEIKRELVWSGPVMRPGSVLVRRRWSVVETRTSPDEAWGPAGGQGDLDEWESDPGSDGGQRSRDRRTPVRGWSELTRSLQPWQSMLTELADPHRAPELLAVRRMMGGWRFYDGFRTDAHAPARRSQVGTRTPVLADDGADLAAALQTIRENGRCALDAAVADAFQGAVLEIGVTDGRFDVQLHQPGMLRALSGAELSDGTLRYLIWVAALLTVDPPPLMVLNEPETSLHPDLIGPLARLIRSAAERSQVMVVSHSAVLMAALGIDGAGGERDPDRDDEHAAGLGTPTRSVTLVKDLGETFVQGQGLLTTPPWNWGARR